MKSWSFPAIHYKSFPLKEKILFLGTGEEQLIDQEKEGEAKEA